MAIPTTNLATILKFFMNENGLRQMDLPEPAMRISGTFISERSLTYCCCVKANVSAWNSNARCTQTATLIAAVHAMHAAHIVLWYTWR